MTEINWDSLLTEARRIMKQAYVPYSKYPVGAAALTNDGRIVSGCNVENASYGLTLCAECGLVSSLHATGGGTLVAFACVDGNGDSLTPCGRCRQLLFEHGGPTLQIWDSGRILTMDQLLPGAFGPDHLS
ncbi:MAG: cytidine deaminase [Actinomycetota bacterium]|jgi:cytidine deaminase